jgi:hypothetical protein
MHEPVKIDAGVSSKIYQLLYFVEFICKNLIGDTPRRSVKI